jgi:hypothetical protein
MKKQNDRKANGTQSVSPALTDTIATTPHPVHRKTGESSISSDQAIELIRTRAYHLFESRGRRPGHAVDDWLQAERQILRPSTSPEGGGITCSC